ncbi:MAG: hypothetical protein H7062_03365 [Candidatus Saccharimonas sp.]|nr:hypothetical protein [Planctomycetaceae bacterium]
MQDVGQGVRWFPGVLSAAKFFRIEMGRRFTVDVVQTALFRYESTQHPTLSIDDFRLSAQRRQPVLNRPICYCNDHWNASSI